MVWLEPRLEENRFFFFEEKKLETFRTADLGLRRMGKNKKESK
jgi:hypothetical protein